MSNKSSPALAVSPATVTQAPSTGLAPKPLTKIGTSKEWVLPPRPKPGRKPSADTPATKRKAQNRAAQRAFRERRATRVTELEDRLGEVEKEKELSVINFQNVVNKLQSENKFLLKALNDIKADYASFKQSMLVQPNNIGVKTPPAAVFSNGQVSAPSPLNYYKPSSASSSNSRTTENSISNYEFPSASHNHSHSPSSLPKQTLQSAQVPLRPQPTQGLSPLNPGRSPADTHYHSSNTTPSTKASSISSTEENYDCGVCIKDDCICAQVGIKPSPGSNQKQVQNSTLSLENTQPMTPVSLKRKNSQVEIDYTAKFAKLPAKSGSRPMPKFKKLKSVTQVKSAIVDDSNNAQFSTVFDKITDKDFESPTEQCGFCSDDTPCVCREAAKEAANAIAELQNHSRQQSKQESSTLAPISRHSSMSNIKKLPVLHPGPTVELSPAHRSSISTPRETKEDSTKKAGCTGNPGTCSQCQLDPMSTLFCTTIASKAEDDEQKQESNQSSSRRVSISSTREPSSASLKDDTTKNSPVSPPISNHSSKASSPMTVQEEELNSLKKPEKNINGSLTGSVNGGNVSGIYIPCADAYKTLSRHKEFHSVDFSTLVGKLNTRGMQVEVQSVANVLRELDRRLYN